MLNYLFSYPPHSPWIKAAELLNCHAGPGLELSGSYENCIRGLFFAGMEITSIRSKINTKTGRNEPYGRRHLVGREAGVKTCQQNYLLGRSVN